MNLIKHYADNFLEKTVVRENNYGLFIDEVNKQLANYKKEIQKVIFLERIFLQTKIKLDNHLKFCTEMQHNNCRFSKFYEIVLFFLQSEIDYYENRISVKYLKKYQRISTNKKLNHFIGTLEDIKFRNSANYIVFKNELNEMKHYYYLDKKNWRQLFIGKITELTENNIISNENAKVLIEKIDITYQLKISDYAN